MVAINLHYLGQLGDQKIPAAYGFMLMLVTVIVQSAAFGNLSHPYLRHQPDVEYPRFHLLSGWEP